MWLWVLLTSLTIGNLIWATPETIGSEYSSDDADDSLFLYMDERSLDNQRPDHRDIEARRRSALDKNFMRFGRSDGYVSKNYAYDSDDLESDEFSRDERSHNKNDNFIRFGRGREDFMRFGRDPYKYMSRMSRGIKDKNFIRFGRSIPVRRTRRDVYSTEAMDQQYKRGNNRDMLRFGRRDNFLRFGRFPYDNQDTHEQKQNTSNDNQAKSTVSPYSTLVDLLSQLALQMRNKNEGIPRNG